MVACECVSLCACVCKCMGGACCSHKHYTTLHYTTLHFTLPTTYTQYIKLYYTLHAPDALPYTIYYTDSHYIKTTTHTHTHTLNTHLQVLLLCFLPNAPHSHGMYVLCGVGVCRVQHGGDVQEQLGGAWGRGGSCGGCVSVSVCESIFEHYRE
jgi:hypothetical protein